MTNDETTTPIPCCNEQVANGSCVHLSATGTDGQPHPDTGIPDIAAQLQPAVIHTNYCKTKATEPGPCSCGAVEAPPAAPEPPPALVEVPEAVRSRMDAIAHSVLQAYLTDKAHPIHSLTTLPGARDFMLIDGKIADGLVTLLVEHTNKALFAHFSANPGDGKEFPLADAVAVTELLRTITAPEKLMTKDEILNMLEIDLIGNGEGSATCPLNPDTGESIPGVLGVFLIMAPNSPPVAVLDLAVAPDDPATPIDPATPRKSRVARTMKPVRRLLLNSAPRSVKINFKFHRNPDMMWAEHTKFVDSLPDIDRKLYEHYHEEVVKAARAAAAATIPAPAGAVPEAPPAAAPARSTP